MNDDILAKARKLLAKGEGTDNPHEAEIFTKKAMELIAQYGIDEALLAENSADKRKVGEIEVECHAPFSQEKAILFNSIAIPLGCKAVMRKRWRDGNFYRASQSDRKVLTMHAFGRESDLRRLEMLYTSLLLQQATAFKHVTVPSWETASAYRRSWLQGYAGAILARLTEAERAAAKAADERPERAAETASGHGTALVLARREREVEEAFREAYPRTKSSKARSGGGGFSGGHAEGQRASLDGTGVSAGSRGALGR